jgi:predicted Zn-dependent protease
MRLFRTFVLLALAAACSTNPATGRRQLNLLSEQDEIQLGRQSDAEVRQQMGVYRDDALQRYVDGIGQRLARAAHRPGLPWTFTVVDEPAVNAFALPGGFIYVTRGILPFIRSEAELAAVLGHEVGHVDARHSAQAYSRQTLAGGSLAVLGVLVPKTRPAQGLAGLGLGLIFLKNSRENELEADQLGVNYVTSTGWQPEAMPALLETLARLDEASGSSRGVPNWALTHPPAADRVTQVRAAVVAARPGGAAVTNVANYERYLNGMTFGDSREKGIVRGTDFLHPVLRFAVRFPDGWEVRNSDEQVSAQPPGEGNAAMILEVASGGSGSVEQTARTNMLQAGFRETSGQRTDINGLGAYIGIYEGTMNGTPITLHAAHIRSADQTYVIAGVAATSQFARLDPVFRRSIESFRALSRQEADRIQSNRVEFYTVRNGDTWESLARGVSGGHVKPSTLAIMNGADPAAQPRSGDRIRIVVPG